MTHTHAGEPSSRKPLRLWPGVVAAVLLLVLRLIAPLVIPDGAMGVGILGALVAGLAIIVWWMFFSRAPWPERIGAIILMAVALLATSRLVHASISNGMMGMMLPIVATPVLCLALVASVAASRRLSSGVRRVAIVVAILLASGVFTLIRTGGITGDGDSDLHWRWTPSPEDRLLAQSAAESAEVDRGTSAPTRSAAAASEVAKETPAARANVPSLGSTRSASAPLPSASAATKAPEKSTVAEPADAADVLPSTPAVAKRDANWPGFRGPDRNGIVRGVQIATDWSASPPVQLWRRPIGPGWSSFAVRGDVLYTQEQRGDDEVVAAYSVTTGEPVWRHRDAVRFWESNGGAGPRGTPTLSHDRVYALGATGVLNALDASDGAVVWSRNAATDTGRKIPDWGIASSPLVVGNLVVIGVSGTLAAYDLATGTLRWSGPAHGGSYSSPQLLTIDGVEQILLLNGAGATSVAVADGTLLWEHAWPGTTIVQPALIANGDILISTSSAAGAIGMRRIAVAHTADGWTVEERWTSNGLKPYFNDYVVHNGHAFGFDGSILACINLEDGKRTWKNGRYGNGQLVLLPEQHVLLVLSEDGELALVGATPDQFTELARVPALDGKTWNHPVLVGNVLLIRNGEEMAAFRLSRADHTTMSR